MNDSQTPGGEGESFFSRWSRRKVEVRQAPAPSDSSASEAKAAQPELPQVTSDTQLGTSVQRNAVTSSGEIPKLTLADVEKLTAESDFSAFTGREVDPAVRNAAMKKLFHAEPHFNVMDGLDVYIDDYNTPDPLPKAIMRTMLQARALGLLDDELKDQDKPEPDLPPSVAQQADTPAPHEDTDLQLQPNDAAGHAGAGTGLEGRAPGEGATDPRADNRPNGEPGPVT